MSEGVTVEPLRLAAAARAIGVPTREIVDAVYYRRIRFVMVDGIACIPPDALDDYAAGQGRSS